MYALIPNSTQVKGCRPVRSALGNASFSPSSNSSKQTSTLEKQKQLWNADIPYWQSSRKRCPMFSVHAQAGCRSNFRPSVLKSIRSMSLKSSCHFWVKQAQDIPQQEADVFISQKMRPIIWTMEQNICINRTGWGLCLMVNNRQRALSGEMWLLSPKPGQLKTDHVSKFSAFGLFIGFFYVSLVSILP